MTFEAHKKSSERPVSAFRGVGPRARGGSGECNGFLAFCNGCAGGGQTMISLANEAPARESGENIIGLANTFDILQDDWLVVPYGDQSIKYMGKVYTQRLTISAANEMVSAFGSFRGKCTRGFVGLPFFIGHPDDAAFANQHKDSAAYGWIMDLAARPDGFAMQVKWSDDGHAIIANAKYKFYSPRWEAKKTGTEDGTPIMEPFWLHSAGFTNNPNWPVFPLANEQQTHEGEDKDMSLLERLRAILSVEGGDEDVVTAVTKLYEVAKKIREAMEAKWDAQSAASDVLPNESPLDDAVSQTFGLIEDKLVIFANQKTELDTAQTALAAETANAKPPDTLIPLKQARES